MYLSMFVHVTMLQAIRVDGRVDMGVFERIKAHRNSMVVFSGAPPIGFYFHFRLQKF